MERWNHRVKTVALGAILAMAALAPAIAPARTITLNVRDAALRDVLQMVARAAKLNLVIGPEAGDQKVSVELTGVEAVRAIRLIAGMYGLKVGFSGKAVLVGSGPAIRSILDRETVKVIPVRSRPAETLLPELRRHFPGLILTVDKHTNSILVSRPLPRVKPWSPPPPDRPWPPVGPWVRRSHLAAPDERLRAE